MNVSLKRSLAVIGIILGVMILAMIWSIVNIALASIQKDLSANVLELQWMMNCFGIFLCVPLLTMGKLGDAYGRKRIFILGLIGTLIASIAAGMTTHVGILIACMGLFGFSGSIILPLSQALLVHQFPESQKEKAVSLWSTFASLSLAIGPLIGGTILQFWGWRWIYLINVPFIVLTIPIVFFFVEKKQDKVAEAHYDWTGVGILALFVGCLVLAIMQGPSWGWKSPIILGLFAFALINLCVFIILERKSSTPLFRTELFSNRAFLFSSIPNSCMIGYIWVAFFIIPLYLQNMKNFTSFKTGLTLLFTTLPVALLSLPVGKCYRKIGAKPLLLAGFSFLIISALLQSLFVSNETFWPIGMGCFILGIGWVLVWGPSISSALSSIPHKLAGTASGMFTTLQELGAVITFSIAGVIFRQSDQSILEQKMSKIDSALRHFSSDEVQSLLTNPSAVEKSLGASSSIIPLLRNAFLGSYRETFWFLVALSIFSIIISSFLPKKKKA